MVETRCLDIALINDYRSSLGQAVIENMLALYSKQVSIYLESILAAKNQDNAEDWKESCHKMKSAAGSLGLICVHQQLNTMETSILTKDEKASAYDRLITVNDEGIAAFKTYCEMIA